MHVGISLQLLHDLILHSFVEIILQKVAAGILDTSAKEGCSEDSPPHGYSRPPLGKYFSIRLPTKVFRLAIRGSSYRAGKQRASSSSIVNSHGSGALVNPVSPALRLGPR